MSQYETLYGDYLKVSPHTHPIRARPAHHFLFPHRTTLHRTIHPTSLTLQYRTLVPRGALHEVAFADLERDPVAVLEGVYTSLGWRWDAAARARVQAHCSTIASFKKNAFVELSAECRKLVAERWRESFEKFGYTM